MHRLPKGQAEILRWIISFLEPYTINICFAIWCNDAIQVEKCCSTHSDGLQVTNDRCTWVVQMAAVDRNSYQPWTCIQPHLKCCIPIVGCSLDNSWLLPVADYSVHPLSAMQCSFYSTLAKQYQNSWFWPLKQYNEHHRSFHIEVPRGWTSSFYSATLATAITAAS